MGFIKPNNNSGGSGGGLTPQELSRLNNAYTHSKSEHAPTTAEENVQADWNETDTTSDSYIKNKPDLSQVGSGEVDLSGYVTKEAGNANQITFSDGQTFQQKLDTGILKGEKGDKGERGEQGIKGDKGDKGDTGADGLTTAISVNGNTYTQVDGTITLPDYPTSVSGGSGGANITGYRVYNVLDYNISTSNEDNTPALQSLMNLVSDNGGGTIFFPVGTYKFKKASTQAGGTYDPGHEYAILAKSNVSIIGENIENTILKCVEATPYSLFYRFVGNSDNTIHGCTYSNFTVDCYDTGSTNRVFGKVFFYQYVKDCVFRDLILKGTIATAMGIDFLDNVEINNVTCIDCGRTFISEGATSGTSGIGIGTGGFENENFKITDCVCVGCGQYGIFIENQHTLKWGGNTDNPKGCIISNCITRNGLYRGIGVRGGTNVIVSNCNSYENAKDGIYLDNKCVNVKISNNNIVENGSNGILIKSNSDSEDIDINDNFIKGNTNYGILLSTNTNGLMLRHNVTKGNAKGGLHSNDGLIHSNTIAKSNIFVDGEDTGNIFTGITDFNELLKNYDTTITAINCSAFTVRVGATITVPYSLTPSYADKSKVTISTTDANYITVDNDAKSVTGVAEGTATLTLEADGVTSTATVTVLPAASSDSIVVNNSDFIKDYKLLETGEVSDSSGAGVTDFIDVASLERSIAIRITQVSTRDGFRVCYYNSNKEFLTADSIYIPNGELQAVYEMKVNMSTECAYIRISLNKLNTSSVEIVPVASASNIMQLESSAFTAGVKIMPNGSETTDANAYSTSYVDISKYVNSGYTKVNIQRTNASGGVRLGQYNSSKTSLSDSFAMSANLSDGGLDVELLSGVQYVRLMLSTGSSTCEATLTFS